MAVNPYDKAMLDIPYGTIQSMGDKYEHVTTFGAGGGGRGGQIGRASPRFTQINRPVVGEFISLQTRINQDNTGNAASFAFQQ